MEIDHSLSTYSRITYFFQENVSVRVARIFNTFGPRMHLADGRVVSNFILQCLQKKNITVSEKNIFRNLERYFFQYCTHDPQKIETSLF